MPVTRSELMYLAAGIAIGGAVGANWSRIRPVLESLLGPAANGFQDAYGDLMAKCSEQVESFSDSRAEFAAASTARASRGRTRRKAAGTAATTPAH